MVMYCLLQESQTYCPPKGYSLRIVLIGRCCITGRIRKLSSFAIDQLRSDSHTSIGPIPRMPAIYEHQHVVQESELDGIGHVNNLSYVKWMQDSAIAHATAQGWPPQRHLECGSGWVVRSHFIEYLRPAFAGDQIVIRTWVAGFRRITSLRKYKILRTKDDQVLAVAETNWAYVSYDTHTPRRIPPEIIASFQIVPPDEEP